MRIVWLSAICFTFFVAIAFGQQAATLQGTIRDSQQQPVPYTNLMIKTTSLTAVTNQDGQFQIKEIPYGTYQ